MDIPERASQNDGPRPPRNAGTEAFAIAAGPLRATAGETRHARGGLKNRDGGETRVRL
jgi:hypothetical protein